MSQDKVNIINNNRASNAVVNLINPKVTVFTSCHNQGEFLDEAIRSVLHQTYKNFEYFLYDDGSTDNTWEIMQKYRDSDPRVIAYRLEKQPALSSVINKCLSNYTGDIWTWCPSDDIFEPTLLEDKVKYFRDNPNAVYFNDFYFINEKSEILREAHPSHAQVDKIKHQIWYQSMIWFTGIFIPRSVFQIIGGFDQVPPLEDLHWSLKATVFDIDFIGVPKILHRKRISTNQTSHTRRLEIPLILKNVYKEINKYIQNFKDRKIKNIVICSTQYPGLGGGATNAYELIKYFRKHGYNVVGLFFYNEENVRVDPDDIGGVFHGGGHYWQSGICLQYTPDKIYNIAYEFLKEKPDVVFCKGSPAVNLSKQIFSCTNVFLVSGLSIFDTLKIPCTEYFKNLDNYGFSYKTVYETTLKNTDIVVFNSPFPLKAYRHFFPEYSHKFYHNIVNTSLAVVKNENLKVENNTNKIFDIILCCSDLSRNDKNCEFLIDLLDNDLKSYSKCFIGKNNDKFMGIANSTCLGIVSHQTCLEHLAKSRVLLFPSLFDANPNTVLEALALGCLPLITKNVGFWEYYPKYLVCESYNPNEWVQKTRHILNNYETLASYHYDILENDNILDITTKLPHKQKYIFFDDKMIPNTWYRYISSCYMNILKQKNLETVSISVSESLRTFDIHNNKITKIMDKFRVYIDNQITCVFTAVNFASFLYFYGYSNKYNRHNILEILRKLRYIVIFQEILNSDLFITGYDKNKYETNFVINFFRFSSCNLISNKRTLSSLEKYNIVDNCKYYAIVGYSPINKIIPLQKGPKDIDILIFGSGIYRKGYKYRTEQIDIIKSKAESHNLKLLTIETFDIDPYLIRSHIVVHVPSFPNLPHIPAAKITSLQAKKIFFMVEQNEELTNSFMKDFIISYQDINDLFNKIKFYLDPQNREIKDKIVEANYKHIVSTCNIDDDIPNIFWGLTNIHILAKPISLSNPMVSIILPTFNRAAMLPPCIKNILDQTYKNFELIVVNDCSTDNTREILSAFKGYQNIKVISNTHNLKLPGALNAGFAAAIGDLLTWTSDDNMLDPKFLETFVQHFDQHPDVDYFYCDYYIFRKDHNEKKRKLAKPLYNTKIDVMVGFFGNAGFMWRRNVYEKIGDFDVNLFGVEDWDYFLRIIFSDDIKIAKINLPLYFFRDHDKSLTTILHKEADKFRKLHEPVIRKLIQNHKQYILENLGLILKGPRKEIVEIFSSIIKEFQ